MIHRPKIRRSCFGILFLVAVFGFFSSVGFGQYQCLVHVIVKDDDEMAAGTLNDRYQKEMDATVSLKNLPAGKKTDFPVTNGEGETKLPNGRYSITVAKEGFETGSKTLTFACGGRVKFYVIFADLHRGDSKTIDDIAITFARSDQVTPVKKER